jgi:hypothetical protein
MTLLPPCYPWYALGTRLLVAWSVLCAQDSVPRIGWGSIVQVKNNKAAVLKTLRIMPRAGAAGNAGGAAGNAGGAAGDKARSTEA